MLLSKMLGVIVFRLKEFVKKDGEWMVNGVASYVFLLFVANCASIGNMCENGEDNSTEDVFDICFVVSSSLVLILLTGTTLEWCDKNNKDQRSSLLFSLSSYRRCHPRVCVDVCVCYHMKSKQKRKEIC